MTNEIPSSPVGPGNSLEESLKFYKTQYELLEAELADFQTSSKDLEAELEKDIEAAEKRERQLKDKAANLQYEVDEWKEKYKQAKSEAGTVQNKLQKEITQLRESYRELQMKLRDIEVANDDFERQQRNTESSLEGMQAQYNSAFEKSVLLQQEVESVEQEREDLRIQLQRLKDELQDFRIEAEITKEKLKKAEGELNKTPLSLSIQPVHSSMSPRSELSPTTTNTSVDTPPAKTASSSGISDAPTPPSPPTSDRSTTVSKPLTTPSVPKTRLSMNVNTTPRQQMYPSRANGHTRGASLAVTNRTGPTSTFRQSLSRPPNTTRQAGLPQSSSIMQLRNLRGKMQNLEQRVQKARSKLPAPISTPPRASPRSGSALDHHIPSSVTVRSRKRTLGSNIHGNESLPDSSDTQSTPSVPLPRASRQSLNHYYNSHSQSQSASTTASQTGSPIRGSMAPPRPSSRASGFVPSHSRPGSRASVSNFRTLGAGVGSKYTPNASTDRVAISRPHSSFSDHSSINNYPPRYNIGYDGNLDEANENEDSVICSFTEDSNHTSHSHSNSNLCSSSGIGTPTPRRRSTLHRPRTSDIGSAIPIPLAPGGKRQSLSASTSSTRLPGPSFRTSTIEIAPESRSVERSPSRSRTDRDVTTLSYDINETF